MITEEKRQALIDEAMNNIDNLKVAIKHCGQDESYALELDLDLQEIALASLQAEVGIGVRVVQQNERLKGFDFDGYENLNAGHHHFYTAPPVPVMQPVQLPPKYIALGSNRLVLAMSREINKMRNECETAIRAAGYEVANERAE